MPPSPGKPLISVVVATYNGERFIGDQLQSILTQTYSPIEIIVVDDCSTDRTLNILKQFAAIHPNLLVIGNEENLGYIKNFEKGLQLAKGSFVALSDQDDLWLPEKLSILHDLIGDKPIVYSNSTLIDENGKPIGKKLSDIKRLATFDTGLNYLIGNSAPGHAMLIQKEVVSLAMPFPEKIPHDYWLGFVGTLLGPVVYTDQCLVEYRQHVSNVFGVTKNPSRKKTQPTTKESGLKSSWLRIKLMYDKCPDQTPLKGTLLKFLKCYEKNGLSDRWARVILFLKYNRQILAFKRRSAWRRWLFCLRMFFQPA
jgi:glycosyltransferase involved in cell wall biosynthesis